MSNSALVTTGPEILTIGSGVTFQLSPWKGGLLWDVVVATLRLTAPDGTTSSTTVGASGGQILVPWTVIAPEGTWVRAWSVTGSDGVHLISLPITFRVIQSPGTPF